jgi:hypothetical protein
VKTRPTALLNAVAAGSHRRSSHVLISRTAARVRAAVVSWSWRGASYAAITVPGAAVTRAPTRARSSACSSGTLSSTTTSQPPSSSGSQQADRVGGRFGSGAVQGGAEPGDRAPRVEQQSGALVLPGADLGFEALGCRAAPLQGFDRGGHSTGESVERCALGEHPDARLADRPLGDQLAGECVQRGRGMDPSASLDLARKSGQRDDVHTEDGAAPPHQLAHRLPLGRAAAHHVEDVARAGTDPGAELVMGMGSLAGGEGAGEEEAQRRT